MKKIEKEKTPGSEIPYRNVNTPFRVVHIIPADDSVEIEQDAAGVCYIRTKGGESVQDLVAGDNIRITRNEDGQIVISAVDTATEISAGQNITIEIDPETGAAVINSITGGAANEHYQGVFDTVEDLIAHDQDPETGDYGLIKNITFSDGGDITWNGQYKYCFWINGAWTVVDQMLTFTDDVDLLQQFYSVGGSSPVIYLHEIARSGDFNSLRNIPIVATPVVTVEGDTVTAECATEGAEIWYTTDGTMPHVNGTKYTGPITVTEATTFRFVGIKNGMINSLEAVAGADYSLAPPVIDYDYHTATVTLSNPNLDGNNDPIGEIHYTIDGAEPTSSSPLYVGPFGIQTPDPTQGRTVRAVVYDNNNDVYSEISTESYWKAKTNGVSSSNAESGRISQFWVYPKGPTTVTQASDGESYYTLDGSNPNYESTPFTETLYFMRYGGPVTLKVIGYRPGCLPTPIRTVIVGYDKPTAPNITFNADTNTVTIGASGNVTANPAIPMKTTAYNPTIGYRIYYTLDGSTPTAQSTLYTGPFQISGNVTVKAVLIAYGQYSSDVTTEAIVQMQAPVISMDSDTGYVSIQNPNGSGTVYYTMDASTPTDESSEYTEPFLPVGGTNIRAIVIDDGSESPVAAADYEYTNAYLCLSVGSPTFNYSIGRITQTVSKTAYAPQGSFIRYTLDGTLPNSESPIYEGPVTFDYYDPANPRGIMARLFCPGYLPGASVGYGANYGYKTPTAPVIDYDADNATATLSLAGNTARIPLQTNNNVPSMGARIYYTLDGSTPTAQNGTLYTGAAFAVPDGTSVIKAVTVCYGEFESDVSTETLEEPVEYLTFTAEEANSTVSMLSTLETAPNLEYSIDGGQTWQTWNQTTAEGLHTFDTLTLGAVGDAVKLRGVNPNGFNDIYNELVSFFSMTGKIAASGNVQTLVDGDTPTLVAKMMPLFSDFSITHTPSDVLTAAPSLPATTLSFDCYFGMFSYCTGLTAAPSLPATTLSYECYLGMFHSCTGLTAAPSLPATTLAEGCYSMMFLGCTGLTAAPSLPATTLAEGCYSMMFLGCTFDMSDDGTTFNFDCSATLPQTVGDDTYSTPCELAISMGNTNGFDQPEP